MVHRCLSLPTLRKGIVPNLVDCETNHIDEPCMGYKLFDSQTYNFPLSVGSLLSLVASCRYKLITRHFNSVLATFGQSEPADVNEPFDDVDFRDRNRD